MICKLWTSYFVFDIWYEMGWLILGVWFLHSFVICPPTWVFSLLTGHVGAGSNAAIAAAATKAIGATLHVPQGRSTSAQKSSLKGMLRTVFIERLLLFLQVGGCGSSFTPQVAWWPSLPGSTPNKCWTLDKLLLSQAVMNSIFLSYNCCWRCQSIIIYNHISPK